MKNIQLQTKFNNYVTQWEGGNLHFLSLENDIHPKS